VTNGDPTVEDNWRTLGIFAHCSRIEVKDLEAGKLYSFRLRGLAPMDQEPGQHPSTSWHSEGQHKNAWNKSPHFWLPAEKCGLSFFAQGRLREINRAVRLHQGVPVHSSFCAVSPPCCTHELLQKPVAMHPGCEAIFPSPF